MGQRRLNHRAATTTPTTVLILTILRISHTPRLSASVHRRLLVLMGRLTVRLMVLLRQVLTPHPLLVVSLIHLHTLAFGPRHLLLVLLTVITKVLLTGLRKAMDPSMDIRRWSLRLSRTMPMITMGTSQSLSTCLRQQVASTTLGMRTERRPPLR